MSEKSCFGRFIFAIEFLSSTKTIKRKIFDQRFRKFTFIDFVILLCYFRCFHALKTNPCVEYSNTWFLTTSTFTCINILLECNFTFISYVIIYLAFNHKTFSGSRLLKKFHLSKTNNFQLFLFNGLSNTLVSPSEKSPNCFLVPNPNNQIFFFQIIFYLLNKAP